MSPGSDPKLQSPVGISAVVALLGVGFVLLGETGSIPERPLPGTQQAWPERIAEDPESPSDAALTAVMQRSCVACHNDVLETGNLSLQSFAVESAAQEAEVAEKIIAKLRAEMMPPPGMPRPGGDTLALLAETLERKIDEAAAGNVGIRTFQRLNRAEYERSVRSLLGLEVDAGGWLPLDMRMANFDNIADVQVMSASLLESYLNAAAAVSRMALGDPEASPREVQYRVPRWISQTDRVEGAPFGSRGGTARLHNFVADGEYVFRVSFHHETTGALVGNAQNAPHTVEVPEQLEISIDGEPVALLEVDPWAHVAGGGVEMETEPIFIEAGPRRVAAAFVQRFEGPVQDVVRPHDWSLASTAIAGRYGAMVLPHLRDLVIAGPAEARGVSEHPIRERILTCRPGPEVEARDCAAEILSRLARDAYRRPLREGELEDLLQFYDLGVEEGGFEIGVRTGLEAVLASPHFVFRLEEEPGGMEPGTRYSIGEMDLASRLSFFLWALPPDEELLELAEAGRLSQPDVLEEQVWRMLGDARSEALATRFAAQWLRLHDLDDLQPDVRRHPEFHEQLRDAMRRETERFFHHLVQEDRSLMELYTAEYTFLNERLARHYGIPGVAGDHFRRVEYPEGSLRKGVLSHGSILASTSHAGRTSPTDRGKWVMEVILGTPPPPPPPVPALEETASTSEEGRQLTTRERMAIHAENPACNACHQFMDPIGIALDHFDVTGQYRTSDYGLPLDTRGELYDGTPIQSLDELLDALLARPIPLVRTFTENLLTYALGRRVEWYDKPTVRAIAGAAAEDDYRMSSFILGVVQSEPFRMKQAAGVADVDER